MSLKFHSNVDRRQKVRKKSETEERRIAGFVCLITALSLDFLFFGIHQFRITLCIIRRREKNVKSVTR